MATNATARRPQWGLGVRRMAPINLGSRTNLRALGRAAACPKRDPGRSANTGRQIESCHPAGGLTREGLTTSAIEGEKLDRKHCATQLPGASVFRLRACPIPPVP